MRKALSIVVATLIAAALLGITCACHTQCERWRAEEQNKQTEGRL